MTLPLDMLMEMRGLSLLQPWATLMAFREKRIETRSWQTRYRGLVAIAASARWEPQIFQWATDTLEVRTALRRHAVENIRELPLGSILAVGRLTACVPTDTFEMRRYTSSQYEASFGDYTVGRFAWLFPQVYRLRRPVPVKGMFGLYPLPEETIRAVAADLQDAA